MNMMTNTLDSDSIDAGVSTTTRNSRAASTWLGTLIANVRTATAARALRATLAGMDENQLRDIGIADHEIYRIRRQDSFTPQCWL